MSNRLEHNQYFDEPKVITLKKVKIHKPKPVAESFSELSMEEQYKLIETRTKEADKQHEALKLENERLIEEAKQAINQEKTDWETEKEELEKLAREQGHQAGFAAGKEAALQEYQGLIDKANGIIESAMKDYHRTIEKHKNGVVSLAITVAEKIITMKMEEDPTVFTEIIKEALDELKDKQAVEIILHPDDYELVLEQKVELEQILDEETNLIIRMDSGLQAKSCMLVHPFGKIDVGIDSQLQQIKRALAEKVMGQE